VSNFYFGPKTACFVSQCHVLFAYSSVSWPGTEGQTLPVGANDEACCSTVNQVFYRHSKSIASN